MASSKNKSRQKTKKNTNRTPKVPKGVESKTGRSSIRLLADPVTSFRKWRRSLRPRSPHRSFRRTYRRDYVRPLNIPGYLPFTVEVWRTMWRFRSVFIPLTVLYAVISSWPLGVISQDLYMQLVDLVKETDGADGIAGSIENASILLSAGLFGELGPDPNEGQRIISGLLMLMLWLTTVWLLRASLAGHKPRMLDGLYNAGAPIVSATLIMIFIVFQLIPAAIAAIGVSAASESGLISGGIESMVFWVAVGLLVMLSLYWMVSSVMALVVVTLPGMYPLRALKISHELVVGRRLGILLRFAWLSVVTLVFLAVVLIPIILIDSWMQDAVPALAWLPVVPVSLLIASSASAVWVAGYTYILYRKVVDDGTDPA